MFVLLYFQDNIYWKSITAIVAVRFSLVKHILVYLCILDQSLEQRFVSVSVILLDVLQLLLNLHCTFMQINHDSDGEDDNNQLTLNADLVYRQCVAALCQ